MSQLILKISTKPSSDAIRLSKDRYYYFNNYQQSNFLTQTNRKEVKIKLNKNQKKQLIKILGIATLSTAVFLIVAHPMFAAPLTSPVVTQTVPTAVMPDSIKTIGAQFIKITTITGTVLAIILSQLAGGYKMLRKSKEASEWLSEIIKGYATVIVAPVLIMTIAVLAYLLFSNIPWFVSPF